MSLYAIGRPIVASFFRLSFKLRIKGADFIPEDGPLLVCSNHRSLLDPPLIGMAMPRTLSYMAKEELFKVPLFGSLIRSLHAFPVKRGAGDRAAIRTALAILKDNHALLMFPEGTRNRSDTLKKAMSGVGFFALHSNAAVVPCAIIGNYKCRRPLTVVFGKPIDIADMRARGLKAAAAAAEITAHIQTLIEENGGQPKS
ncbi:MAG: lysophospholipid acyltransferase family protein [Sporolactobacillus sp.]